MKKIIIVLSFTLFTSFSYAQDSYKSSTGYVYKVGDIIQLGEPIGYHNGLRKSTFTIKWKSVFSDQNKIIRDMNLVNMRANILKIDTKNEVKLYFEINNIKYYLLIEKALRLGELKFSESR